MLKKASSIIPQINAWRCSVGHVPLLSVQPGLRCSQSNNSTSRISEFNAPVDRASYQESANSGSFGQKSGLFFDQETSENLHVERKAKLSREEFLQRKQFEHECLRKVIDVADGKMDYEALSLQVLCEALKNGAKMQKNQFIVQYFNAWWRLFENSIASTNFDLENLIFESGKDTCEILDEIFYKIGSLNLHSNGLLRTVMPYTSICYLQMVATKLLPATSPKMLCQIFDTFENLYLIEDFKYPWHFFSQNFVENVIKRLTEMETKILDLEGDHQHEILDLYCCIARISCILAKMNAPITSEQQQLLIDFCGKVIQITSSNMAKCHNESSIDKLGEFIYFGNTCMGHFSAANVLIKWCLGSDAETQKAQWSSWFAGTSNLMEWQNSLQLLANEVAAKKLFGNKYETDIRISEIYKMAAILSRLCSMSLFVALGTNSMESFDNMRSIWTSALERSFQYASYATAKRLHNEISHAEFYLLKNANIKTVDVNLIGNDFRTKLLEKAVIGREQRLAPYVKATNDSYDDVTGRFNGQRRRLSESNDSPDHLPQENYRSGFQSSGSGSGSGGQYQQSFGADRRTGGSQRYQRSDVTMPGRRYGRPDFEEVDQERPPYDERKVPVNRADQEDGTRRGRLNYRNNFEDTTEDDKDDDLVDSLSSRSPSYRQRIRTSYDQKRGERSGETYSRKNNFAPESEKRHRRVNNADNHEDDTNEDSFDDFGSMAMKRKSGARTRGPPSRKLTDDDSEFL